MLFLPNLTTVEFFPWVHVSECEDPSVGTEADGGLTKSSSLGTDALIRDKGTLTPWVMRGSGHTWEHS